MSSNVQFIFIIASFLSTFIISSFFHYFAIRRCSLLKNDSLLKLLG